MGNNIIFLDHDGVICLSQQWGGRLKHQKRWKRLHPNETILPVPLRFDKFDNKAVNVLNNILAETDAEIVVSSDWKMHCTLDEMKEIYSDYGVCKQPISYTPNMKDFDESAYGLYTWRWWPERIRICEIREWLRLNPDVTSWVAIDDLNMGREGLENFVLSPSESEGIKQHGIKKKVISILNGLEIDN